ncbi:MAG TPA: TolC family protein [Sphingobacteriaceae bacterium]|nr:TolC family protein [Sphingobacteriaceae bacterium]
MERLKYWMQNINEMKKRALLLFFSIIFLQSAFAQAPLTLEDIFRQIKQENPQLRMSEAEIRALDEAAKGARNWEAPQFGTGFWMTPYNPSLWRRGSDGRTGMGQYMISGQQMIPNRSRQNANASYMNAASSVGKFRRSATLNELLSEAKKNVHEWQILRKKIAILNQNEKVIALMIKDTEIRYKNNQGNLSAYYKVKAAVGEIQNMRIMLENEIQQRQIQLNILMNRDKELDFKIDTTYTIKDYSKVVLDSSTLSNSRSDIRAVEQDINLVQLQRNLEQTSLKPEFGIKYEHMFGLGGSTNQFTLMGMVKIPAPWSTQAARANIESFRWRAEALNQQKRMVLNEATGMASKARKEFELKKKQVKLFENNIIPALRKNYQTILIAYGQNTEQLFELYDAWETLNSTQLNYLDQVQDLLIMQDEFERLLEIK